MANSKWLNALIPFAAVLIASMLVSFLAGENPIHVLSVLFTQSLGSPTSLGYTLYYATPLIFTGLSIGWGLRAGLFNIGGEGQMILAGVALAAIGGLACPWYIAIPFALIVSAVTGALWSSLAGYLKAKRGVHEVLSTILLNFIAYGISSFFISIVLRDPMSQVPETVPLMEGYWLPEIKWLNGGSPFNFSFFIALLCAGVYGFLDSKTEFGFRQRLVGEARGLARQTGTHIDRQVILALFIAGAFSGLAAINEIMGYLHKTKENFSAGAGFVGIAVALMGRGKWYGIILASILFGAIHKGSLDLDIDTERITRDFAAVLQGLIILFVCAEATIKKRTSDV